MEEIWNNAFNIAMNYCKDRVTEVAQVLGQRLTNIQRYETAGEFYEAVGFFEKAIQAFIDCKKFDKAMDCVRNVRPAEMQNMLAQKIQQHQKAMYINEGKINKLVESGDMQGLDMLASRGQWEECLSLAEKQGPDFLNTYLMKFSNVLL